MRKYEKIVKQVLEKYLNTKLKYNEFQANGECDFEIYCKNKNIPVEVTRSVDETLEKMKKELKRNKFSRIERNKSDKSWWVILKKEALLKSIKPQIDDLLYGLEQNNIDIFSSIYSYKHSNLDESFRRTINKLRKLNIDYAKMKNFSNNQGIIILDFPGAGTKVEEENINIMVKKECNKSDNLRKLNKNMKARHLAIYVDESNYDCWKPMVDISKPLTSPKLEIENVTVWLITSVSNVFVILQSKNNSKWVKLENIKIDEIEY